MAGTKHDQDKPRMDLLDHGHLVDVAKVLTFGAEKYGTHNWREGIPASRLFAAMQRHLAAFWQGEDLDEESGLPHLDHAATCMMMLSAGLRDDPKQDDRYKKETKEIKTVVAWGVPYPFID